MLRRTKSVLRVMSQCGCRLNLALRAAFPTIASIAAGSAVGRGRALVRPLGLGRRRKSLAELRGIEVEVLG